MVELTERGKIFRHAITTFIEARRDAKLKGKDDATDTASKYGYTAWLTDAARRVGQIQAVTHVLKATHPDARGSSLHVVPDRLPAHAAIGSHVLGEGFAEDVVGNAAALDVFKFLKLDVEGRRLLDWMQDGDSDLCQALDDDPATARDWMQAFAALVREDTEPTSHPRAKQLYWLVGEDPADNHAYHLLQPMFSSSLAHAVHAEIQDARFGEANKLARQAFRAKAPHEHGYREYRHLVARKLGGTKPQNISQLNSERGGVNYLLSSLPPTWARDLPRNLLHLDSAMDRLIRIPAIRQQVKELTTFLLSDPPPTHETRTRREAFEQELGAQLALFAAEVRARFNAGWTRATDCRLPLCEQLWLDPERIELPPREDHAQEDADFNAAYHRGDWPEEVAGRFARWLNQRLHDTGLSTVGDAEYAHWAKTAIVEAAWPVPMQRPAPGGAA